jgi:O-methyltransferase
MRRGIAKLINTVLASLNVRLTRANIVADHDALLETGRRHARLVPEIEALLREIMFPDLPARSGRSAMLAQLDGTTVAEAMYLLDRLNRSLPCGGHVCEFGVARGGSAALIANELIATDRRLWLFDSFQGLPRPTERDVLIDDISGLNDIAAYEGTMAFGPEHVRARLAAIGFPPERVNIVAGFVPDSLAGVGLPEAVCFAYVDFDFYEPIRAALAFLAERLVVGGHILVDDYGYFSTGAQAAVDAFVAAQNGAYVFTLPHPAAGKFCMLERVA